MSTSGHVTSDFIRQICTTCLAITAISGRQLIMDEPVPQPAR